MLKMSSFSGGLASSYRLRGFLLGALLISSFGRILLFSLGQRSAPSRRNATRGTVSELDKLEGVWVPQYHEVYSSNPDLSCKTDPDQAKCCPVEDRSSGCLIAIIRPSDGCTKACQKKYATLGFECWRGYHKHFQWQQAARNCDPENQVVFKLPEGEQEWEDAESNSDSDSDLGSGPQLLSSTPMDLWGSPEDHHEQQKATRAASSFGGEKDNSRSPVTPPGLFSLLFERRFWDMMLTTIGATALLTMSAAGGATFLFGQIGVLPSKPEQEAEFAGGGVGNPTASPPIPRVGEKQVLVPRKSEEKELVMRTAESPSASGSPAAAVLRAVHNSSGGTGSPTAAVLQQTASSLATEEPEFHDI